MRGHQPLVVDNDSTPRLRIRFRTHSDLNTHDGPVDCDIQRLWDAAFRFDQFAGNMWYYELFGQSRAAVVAGYFVVLKPVDF